MLETRKGRGGRSTTPFELDDWQLGDTQKYINAEFFKGFVATLRKKTVRRGGKVWAAAAFGFTRWQKARGSGDEGII